MFIGDIRSCLREIETSLFNLPLRPTFDTKIEVNDSGRRPYKKEIVDFLLAGIHRIPVRPLCAKRFVRTVSRWFFTPSR